MGRTLKPPFSTQPTPMCLSPQLCAAAQEAPIRVEELNLFGPHTEALLDRLVQQGYLRRRADGWFWTHAESAADLVDIRGTGGGPYQLIERAGGYARRHHGRRTRHESGAPRSGIYSPERSLRGRNPSARTSA